MAEVFKIKGPSGKEYPVEANSKQEAFDKFKQTEDYAREKSTPEYAAANREKRGNSVTDLLSNLGDAGMGAVAGAKDAIEGLPGLPGDVAELSQMGVDLAGKIPVIGGAVKLAAEYSPANIMLNKLPQYFNTKIPGSEYFTNLANSVVPSPPVQGWGKATAPVAGILTSLIGGGEGKLAVQAGKEALKRGPEAARLLTELGKNITKKLPKDLVTATTTAGGQALGEEVGGPWGGLIGGGLGFGSGAGFGRGVDAVKAAGAKLPAVIEAVVKKGPQGALHDYGEGQMAATLREAGVNPNLAVPPINQSEEAANLAAQTIGETKRPSQERKPFMHPTQDLAMTRLGMELDPAIKSYAEMKTKADTSFQQFRAKPNIPYNKRLTSLLKIPAVAAVVKAETRNFEPHMRVRNFNSKNVSPDFLERVRTHLNKGSPTTDNLPRQDLSKKIVDAVNDPLWEKAIEQSSFEKRLRKKEGAVSSLLNKHNIEDDELIPALTKILEKDPSRPLIEDFRYLQAQHRARKAVSGERSDFTPDPTSGQDIAQIAGGAGAIALQRNLMGPAMIARGARGLWQKFYDKAVGKTPENLMQALGDINHPAVQRIGRLPPPRHMPPIPPPDRKRMIGGIYGILQNRGQQ